MIIFLRHGQAENNTKKSKKSRKTKCLHCNKKFLIVHLCKCNNHYCSVHRCPESHNCTFDFKNDSTNKIEFVDCNFKKLDKKSKLRQNYLFCRWKPYCERILG